MKTFFLATAAWFMSCFLTCFQPLSSEEAERKEEALDVNDVTYLWPVPKTKADVEDLISLEDKLSDGMNEILPKNIFKALVETAQTVAVKNSAGRDDIIEFTPFKEPFSKRTTWKIVAFRIDPSAPGASPKLIEVLGSTPQIRLIVQPVTVSDEGDVQVHDVTAHLVYAYVKPSDKPPKAIPDKERFGAIVSDIRKMKTFLKRKEIDTKGPLTVHPGLGRTGTEFRSQVKTFLGKHLRGDRLKAMAFMGLRPPEPWIFFAMQKKEGTFVRTPNPSFEGDGAQMLTFRGGTHVVPSPKTKNLDGMRGVSTDRLFLTGAAGKLGAAVFEDVATLKHKHIPDLIANPQRAHFFNTDCVSCHTESTRRKVLGIAEEETEFRYKRPAGVSGVAAELLPKDQWNVRNLGWFPRGGVTVPTATLRTANEAAESAEFINRVYRTK